ncbi:MAG: hypothetical protein VR65_03640 [Desulfobulbaceae bacterium BRH_c16a]|nr:MAG: hypothetical protein VR65_03640 [Desulfobulbaceae bacterium BRH_c16a]
MELFTHSSLLQNVLSWLAGISFITFFLSLLLIPYLVGRLAPDYFLKFSSKPNPRTLTARSLLKLIARNVLGILLLIAGIAMLFLPGQGLLTILLGILLISLPVKHRLIILLAGLRGVRRSLDWLRKKRRKPPFIWPGSADDTTQR